MEKSHFEQARLWLIAAKYIANINQESSDKYSVATAMLVHAILKANDALTTKFLQKTARKHDEARKFFNEMIEEKRLEAQYAHYDQVIQDAIRNKSKAEYKVSFFSKNSYEDFARKAEKFVEMVDKTIK